MAVPGFIFGGNTGINSPEELARARMLAEALRGPQAPAKTVGEGLAVLGQAIRGRREMNAVNQASTAGQASAQSAIARALGGAGSFPPAPGGGGSGQSSAANYGGDELAWADAKPYQKALLNTIAGPESGGRYNVIYGGGKFDDFSRHPNKAVRIQTGPNAGRTSSAAGKYQFLGSTYEDQAKKLGLTDFSPASQDKAAWNLAAETYKAKTGQDLDTVLQSGDPQAIAQVGEVLNPIWTSLPGGIEQGTNTNRFVATYQRALGAGATPAQAKQVAQQEAQKPVQVASTDPSAGVAQALSRDPLTTMAPGTTAPAYDPSGLPPLDPNDPMAPSPIAAALKLPQQAPVPQTRPNIAAALSAPQPSVTPGAPAAATPAGQRVVQQMVNPQSMTGGAPMPMIGQPAQPGKPQGPGTPGEIRKGSDGKNYQYAETTGMAGATGGQGWIETNMSPQGGGQGADSLPVMAGGSADAIPKGQLPSIQQLVEAAQNPWLNDGQRAMVNMLLKQQMDAQDPANQLGLEKQRLELDALKNPKPKYDFMAGKDGSIFRANETEGSIDQVYGGKPDTFRTLTAEEKAKMGLPAEGAYQIGADNKISQIGGGGTTVNIDQKTEGAFEKKLAEKQAETFDAMSTEGMNAKAELGVIGELDSLLQGQGGTLTGISGLAAKYGIGGEGMGDLQATQAIINKLIPSQRQPGSGTMSDRDVDMFTRSLPSLWNQPGGNQKILNVMRGLATYKQAQGEIADQILAGEISRQEGRKMLRELPNPLAEFTNPPSAPDANKKRLKFNPATGELE